MNTKNLKFDTDIHAVYFPYLTLLESKETRNGPLPIVLVEGKFTGQDSLILAKKESPGPRLDENSTQVEQWNVLIPEDGESHHNIRYLPINTEENLDVYILNAGKWEKIKSQWDGKYLVFESEGNDVSFSIVKTKTSNLKYVFLISLLVLIVIIMFIFTRWIKKRKTK